MRWVSPKVREYSRTDGNSAPSSRSCWMRSMTITSAPASACSSEKHGFTPSASMPAGIMVGGPATRTSAPSLVKQWMSERATRLCAMSPTIAITRFSSVPSDWRRVNASSSAWVGCSWQPSPAFTTGTLTRSASMCGTPATESRTTSTSALIAARLRAMSARVSAFDRLEPERVTLIASAESRFAAISKLTRVRVDASRNTLITVRPRRVGTRLISRCEISSIASEVSSTLLDLGPRHLLDAQQVLHITATSSSPSGRARSATRSAREVGMFLPTKSTLMGSSRWPRSTSTATWIAAGRPKSSTASIAARTLRPVNMTSSTSTTRLPCDRERHARRARHRPHAARDHVVAVERDVERADRHRLLRELRELRGDELGHRLSAAHDRDQAQVVGAGVPLQDLVRDPRRGALDALGVEDYAARHGSRPRSAAIWVVDIALPLPTSLDGLKKEE